jgi:hypothetical protein
MSRFLRSESAPRGPVTWTTSGSTTTVTPVGTGMGLRPMRDMRLPDLRHDFAADLLLAGVVAVMTPRDVETIAVPRPPCTLGMRPAGT